ncbi:hypothetical protein [Mycobacterium sp. M26]|uniref:hypothetical protein n=1 Tax=Mycobacterium sp. M26 TaxID=1762962 RepID=UPI000A9ADB03|nr:hypothetical protein [Mycobacterium sp. M26]
MINPYPIQILAALVNRAQTLEILERTKAKAKRGAALRAWAMRVKQNPIDPGSSLALDDADFMSDYAGDMVSGTTLFPIMNGIDSLTAIAELIDGRDDSEGRKGSGDSHAGSLLTLSRMATESAATTIWLLMNTDQAVRRSLSVRFTASELEEQRRYQSSARKWHENGPGRNDPVQYQNLLEHLRLFDLRVAMLEKGKQQTPGAKVLGKTNVVAAAAKWLDNHPPTHDSAGPYGRGDFGFERAATSFYNVSSAIVHGLKWPLDYMPNGEVDLSRMVVEGVNVAVSMSECAVALFEAQAQNWEIRTERPLLYPDSLQGTIEVWSHGYPAELPNAY